MISLLRLLAEVQRFTKNMISVTLEIDDNWAKMYSCEELEYGLSWYESDPEEMVIIITDEDDDKVYNEHTKLTDILGEKGTTYRDEITIDGGYLIIYVYIPLELIMISK